MIDTEQFHIDLVTLEDTSGLHKFMVANAERFQRYLPKTLAHNMTYEGSKNYIVQKNRAAELRLEFIFMIKEKSGNHIAGLVILKNLDWDKKQGELAYGIGSEAEGRGWATKAVGTISAYAINCLQLRTLQILVHHTNTASVKVAQNCGFIWQRTLKNKYAPPGAQLLDMELYELTS